MSEGKCKPIALDCALGTWQPIETAPKNERLLLWNGTGMYCGHWAKSIETDDEAWIIAEFGNDPLAVRQSRLERALGGNS